MTVCRTIESLKTELEIIGREEAVGMNVTERKQRATEKLTASEQRRGELEARWKSERELVDRILAIRAKLRKGNEKVEGTGSQLEARGAGAEGGRRRCGGCRCAARARPLPRRGSRSSCWPSCRISR